MRIDYDIIKTYTQCPMKYHLIYNKGITKDPPLRERFDYAIHRTVLSYYYMMMNGMTPTQEALRKKWGSMWYKKKYTPAEIALRPESWKSEERKLELQGTSMVINFHRQSQFNKCEPICADYDFMIPFGKHHLAGTIELVRQIEDPKYGKIVEIVDFKTGDYRPDAFMTSHDLSLTIQVYAYRHLFNRKEDRILYHFLKVGNMYYTYRDDAEMKRLEDIVNGVATAIENQLFYPNHSFLCRDCAYKEECHKEYYKEGTL